MKTSLFKLLLLGAGAYVVGYYGLKLFEKPAGATGPAPAPNPPEAPAPPATPGFGVHADLCELFGGVFCYQPQGR